MNKVIYLLIIAISVLSVSCTDELTEKPNGSYDANTFFDSAEHADMAVLGIYSSISNYNHYGWYEMAPPASDDMYFSARTNNDNQVHDIVHYTATSTNSWVQTLWQMKYQGIDRANTAIEGIEAMPQYASDPTLRSLCGEAHFLRAFLAFDLVKFWGDVPFSEKSTETYDQAFKARVSREDIYDVIIKDLDIASALPWASDGNIERPTAGAAYALKMRVLMQRAGYSLQLDGSITRPDDNTRKKYFQDVISAWEAIEENGYHDLYAGGYAALFKSISAGVSDPKENLWEIGMLQEQGRRNGSAWGIYNGPAVAEPTGISPTEQAQYMGRANAMFYAVPEWYDFYETTDERRDVNICTYRYIWNVEQRKHIQQARGKASYYVGKWRREWMSPDSWNKNINYGDVNFCPLRYADMVLLAAEAYNELGDTPKAWDLLNRVRVRAGATAINTSNYSKLMAPIFKTHHPDYIDDSTDEGKFRMALYFERGFELAYEGQRKYDLIRWGILYDALQLFGSKSIVNQGTKNAYPAYKNFRVGHSELLPIPLKEIQSNYKLNGINNPGY